MKKVGESRTTAVSNRPNKIPQLEQISKLLELIIPKDNLYVSLLTGLGSSFESVTPEKNDFFSKIRVRKHHLFQL